MGAKVLLVDDEEQFVDMLAERLEARGFDTRKAYSGEQALERIKEEDADVVILDLVMPGMDGIETLKQLKSVRPLTEVIVLSGHATVDTAIEGMRLGAYDYLMKPTETDDLAVKISAAHGRKAQQEERIHNAEINKIIKTRGW